VKKHKRKISDIQNSDFPHIDHEKFEEWKQSGIIYYRFMTYQLYAFLIVLPLAIICRLGHTQFHLVGYIIICVYLFAETIILKSVDWGSEYPKLCKELSLSENNVDKFLWGEIGSEDLIRLSFWEALLKEFNKVSRFSGTTSFKNAVPSKEKKLTSWTVIGGVSLSFVISRESCQIELSISRGRAKECVLVFEELVSYKKKIEKAAGRKLIWEPLDERQSCRIKSVIKGHDYYKMNEWNAIIDFMVQGMINLEKGLNKPLESISQKLQKSQ
jgi:hypothetical protein